MKKLLILFIASSCFSLSCKKDSKNSDDGASLLDYIDVTIDGKPYKKEFPPANFSFKDQKGCNGITKPFKIQNIGQISIAAYFLDPFLRVYKNEADFNGSAPKSSSVFSVSSFSIDPIEKGCNLDFEIDLRDLSFSNSSDENTTLLKGESSGNISSIKKIEETSTDVDYRIIGSFSCKFKNKNGRIIPVTGKFQTTFGADK